MIYSFNAARNSRQIPPIRDRWGNFLCLAAPAAADFDDRLSAFLDNDYRRAREIWLDLAALGDAQSQFGLGMAEDDEAAQAIARAEEVGSGGPSVRVHIASFRSADGAERGWQILRRNHAELLGGLDLQAWRIDFGAEMGVFYRVQAGPLDNEQGAKELCERLKSRGLYFAVAFF